MLQDSGRIRTKCLCRMLRLCCVNSWPVGSLSKLLRLYNSCVNSWAVDGLRKLMCGLLMPCRHHPCGSCCLLEGKRTLTREENSDAFPQFKCYILKCQSKRFAKNPRSTTGTILYPNGTIYGPRLSWAQTNDN